jgi:hypothetical protein
MFTENQNTHFMFNKLSFQKLCHLRENVEKYGKVRHATDNNIVECICFACSITKATDTHSENVKMIVFSWQKWLCKHASMLLICTLPTLLQLSSVTGEPGGVRLPGLLRVKEKYIWVP